MERIAEKAVRLSDVAERAGVSKATASNVFNRPELVRAEVRDRVLAAAKAMGYNGPDPRGRMLSAGKVNAIGVATAEPLAYFFQDPFARALMVGITEVCDANGIGISLVSAATEDELAWSIKSAVVDGLILFCLEDADRLVAETRERKLPFVTLAFGDTDEDVSVVGVDDVAGARLAAEHLAGLGHRRFAVLAMEFGEGPGGLASPERVAGAVLCDLAAAGGGLLPGAGGARDRHRRGAGLRDDGGPGVGGRGAGGALRRRGAADGAARPVGQDRASGRSAGCGRAGSPCRARSR